MKTKKKKTPPHDGEHPPTEEQQVSNIHVEELPASDPSPPAAAHPLAFALPSAEEIDQVVALGARGVPELAAHLTGARCEIARLTNELTAEKSRADLHVGLCASLESLCGVRGIAPSAAIRLSARDGDDHDTSAEGLSAGLRACRTSTERRDFLSKNESAVNAYFASKFE